MKNNIEVTELRLCEDGQSYSFRINKSLKGLPTDYLQRVIAQAIDEVVEANKPREPKNLPGKPEDYSNRWG